MVPLECARRRLGISLALSGAVLTFVVVLAGAAAQEPRKVDVLRIGTSGNLAPGQTGQKEDSSLKTLKDFIKEETGFDNEIIRQKDWKELADKLAKGELHLGVFEGYEYAWASENNDKLKPLTLTINVHTYPVAYVVTNKDSKAKGFDDLKGQSFAFPSSGRRFLRLYVEYKANSPGKKLDDFFSKITTPDNVEDALDDVVDGKVTAMVVDRAALEAFKESKPGRFKNLKEIDHSKPFPPPVIAYYGTTLEEATREKFRKALVGANRKEKGETMLTLFRLSAIVNVPADFDKVVAETRKTYPPQATGEK